MDQDQIDNMIETGRATLTLTKVDKVRHVVFQKVRIMFLNTVTDQNFHEVVIRVMRELNKHNIYGFQKKDLAIQIVALLLQEFGVPSVVTTWTMESVAILIETIYQKGYHRKHRSCAVL